MFYNVFSFLFADNIQQFTVDRCSSFHNSNGKGIFLPLDLLIDQIDLEICQSIKKGGTLATFHVIRIDFIALHMLIPQHQVHSA
jgi:hypothetical protein